MPSCAVVWNVSWRRIPWRWYTLKGSIQIGYDPQKPEKPTVEGFKGYDRLKFDDGTVFIAKTAKAR
jgi:hypothetical protein